MKNFEIHDEKTAPEGSRPLLEQSIKSFGMVPNLHGVLAASPSALEAYQLLHGLFQNSSFDADELTVVWQTINVEHNCTYCVPAHSMIAHSMKVDAGLIDALRNRKPMPNSKLQALHDTTLKILRNRGHLSEAEVQAFYAEGYGPQQLLEIILGMAQKVMSNYTNHLAGTPLDEPFKKFA
ncbi:carboxymuconolactone decarboxylase family protein [Kiloniella laminariae]|uniref:carboxymuconolactone decarboxylase family protein n=1 Tax=Kiloniella laminariae TaxID=454162 RepID=UPI0003733F14|nr:carboxymuconolactone decarboxylase family protein [Kiloniella laminariae]